MQHIAATTIEQIVAGRNMKRATIKSILNNACVSDRVYREYIGKDCATYGTAKCERLPFTDLGKSKVYDVGISVLVDQNVLGLDSPS